MIARAGSGWQTLLADLSIILFMVTASALAQARGGDGPATRQAPAQASPRAEPLAVWRAGAGAPSLAAWLATQPADPRQRLSIVAHYTPGAGPGAQQAALAEASVLLAEAGAQGRLARLVVEPGDGGVTATIAYDQSAPGMARGLHSQAATSDTKEPVQ